MSTNRKRKAVSTKDDTEESDQDIESESEHESRKNTNHEKKHRTNVDSTMAQTKVVVSSKVKVEKKLTKEIMEIMEIRKSKETKEVKKVKPVDHKLTRQPTYKPKQTTKREKVVIHDPDEADVEDDNDNDNNDNDNVNTNNTNENDDDVMKMRHERQRILEDALKLTIPETLSLWKRFKYFQGCKAPKLKKNECIERTRTFIRSRKHAELKSIDLHVQEVLQLKTKYVNERKLRRNQELIDSKLKRIQHSKQRSVIKKIFETAYGHPNLPIPVSIKVRPEQKDSSVHDDIYEWDRGLSDESDSDEYVERKDFEKWKMDQEVKRLNRQPRPLVYMNVTNNAVNSEIPKLTVVVDHSPSSSFHSIAAKNQKCIFTNLQPIIITTSCEDSFVSKCRSQSKHLKKRIIPPERTSIQFTIPMGRTFTFIPYDFEIQDNVNRDIDYTTDDDDIDYIVDEKSAIIVDNDDGKHSQYHHKYYDYRKQYLTDPNGYTDYMTCKYKYHRRHQPHSRLNLQWRSHCYSNWNSFKKDGYCLQYRISFPNWLAMQELHLIIPIPLIQIICEYYDTDDDYCDDNNTFMLRRNLESLCSAASSSSSSRKTN
jgi:hypothetical protein